jgi:hypothetical protein
VFGDRYLYAGLGTTLDLGATPRAASDRRAFGVPDDGDLRTYRTLLAQSDDLRDGGLDTRSIAVDGKGAVSVGDITGARVQKFVLSGAAAGTIPSTHIEP